MRFLLLLSCAGCLSAASRTQFLDRDGDGAPWPDDCDDADPAVGDGRAWFGDGDGDGVGGAPVGVQGCEAPAGAVSTSGDCDDADLDVRPGVAETLCDGADTDCDATTLDGPASIEGVGYASVQAAVDAAAVGATVELCAGLFPGVVRVETDGLTIVGTGAGETTLDATGQEASAIVIAADGVTLRDLTVRGGAGSPASAAFTAAFGVGFGRVGGGVNATEATGTTRLEDLVVEDCVIEVSAGISVGGGIAGPVTGALVLVRTHVETSEADIGGGLAVGGVTTLEGSTFTGNEGRAFGGGVYLTPFAVVTADSETEVGPGNISSTGGGVSADLATWTGGTIRENTAFAGGGVYLSGGTLSDATISGNVALLDPLGGGGVGGGVFTGSFTEGSVFEANVSGLELTANFAEMGGGGITAVGSDLVLADSTISDSSAPNGGGAYVALTHAVVTRVEFTRNVATGADPSGFGGGLLLADGGVDDYGFPLPCLVAAGCGVELVDGSFILNTANLGGGAYAVTPLDVVGTQFGGNHAFVSGGGLLAVGETTIDAAEFADNTADESGGGLTAMLSDAPFLVLNTDFVSNEASIGAALFVLSTTLVLDGGTVTDNAGPFGAVGVAAGSAVDPTILQVRPATVFTGNEPFDVFADVGYSGLPTPFVCWNPVGMGPGCF